MKVNTIISCLALLVPLGAQAQVSVDLSAAGVRVKTGSGQNQAGNTAGLIESDVEMEGVAVINGDVFIDGEKVPPRVTTVTGKKSGKTYVIKRGRDGDVTVHEK